MSLHELISNPNEYLSKPKKEISGWKFGDVFVNGSVIPLRPDALKLSIILETDESGSFDEHTIKKDSEKEVIFQIGGTGDARNIIEIVDHWDLDRIIKAYTEGCRLAGDKPSFNNIERLRRESKKHPYRVKK